jgi:hypothetical protein
VTLYTRRMQTMLTEQQYEAMLRLSESSGKPVSVLIREAVESTYFEQSQREQRMEALERLVAMNAPVADWKQMEAEIVKGFLK